MRIPIRSEQIIEFLGALKRQIKKPLLIIWDGAAIRRSRKLNAWLEGLDGHIAVARLPPYAPEFNCEGNLELIRKAQMVVANLNPFRGAEPDSGTVFELGCGFAQGKKVWGYVASSESLLERVSRIEGQAVIEGTPHPIDAQGLMIENFGLPLNLMLAMSAHIVTGDLAACIAAIRPRTVAAPAATNSPKEECLGV